MVEDPDSSPRSSRADSVAAVVAVSPLRRLMISSEISLVEEIHLKVSLMTTLAHSECVAKEEAEALSNSNNKENRKDVIHSAAWEWACLMMMMTSSVVALEADSAARACSVR